MSDLFAVLLAGGSGTRFWPLSRVRRPKQFLPIGSARPLLVEASERLQPLVPPERQLVVTGARHADLVRELLPELPPEQVIAEPAVRDTAACIGLASRIVARLDPLATVLVLPSDQVVGDETVFQDVLGAAQDALQDWPERVLVFGIEPTRPATGYGYLRRGAELGTHDGWPLYALDAFVEKPDAERARTLLAAGGHSWNAGMFAFRPQTLQRLYEQHLPAMAPVLQRLAAAFGRDEFEPMMAREFPPLQRVSIDYGIMEKLSDGLLLPLPVTWDDVGSWDALARVLGTDADGNTRDGETLALEARNNVLCGRDGLVAVRGVEGLVVVHTSDATMVCRRDDAEGVKALVQALKDAGRDAVL